MLHRKSISPHVSDVYVGGSRAVPGVFTMKHMPEAVFYGQPHGYPLFFTIRHMIFTMKHMALSGGIRFAMCFIVSLTFRAIAGKDRIRLHKYEFPVTSRLVGGYVYRAAPFSGAEPVF